MTASDTGQLVVAVVGSSGFIGGSIARALDSSSTLDVRRVQRNPTGLDVTTANVTDRSSLRRALADADVVIHAASYVGAEEQQARVVNVDGTTNVAVVCGARPLIYVSTAAVYGNGPFDRVSENSVPRRPRSRRSQTRLAAENIVLATGGAVIRPHLVLGAGDRWVGSAIKALLASSPPDERESAAMHTVINVEVLGRVVSRLIEHVPLLDGVYHVGQAQPVSVCALSAHVAGAQLDSEAIAPRAERTSLSPSLRAAAELLYVDHVFSTQKITALIGPVRDDFRDAPVSSGWYAG